MNKIFNVVWSRVKKAFVVTHELASSGGRKSSKKRDRSKKQRLARALYLLLGGSLLLSPAQLLAQINANSLPQGGKITSGSGTIQTNGNEMVIHQQSDKMITNWQSFNIGSDALVQFHQPSSSSIALNRIHSQDPSQILGQLKANGHLMLINPNGIIFGANSQINVGSLTASTLEISDEDFLAGNYKFTNGDTAKAVELYGDIIANGGSVALVAPVIKNHGTIQTLGGTTTLAAAQEVTLDFSGDGLINITIEKSELDTLIQNSGAIMANDGVVVLKASATRDIFSSVVNNSGTIEATGITKEGGRIFLGGDEVIQSGTLDVSAQNSKGGEITLEADTITLKENSSIDASGSLGGGVVHVGGTWQGGPEMQQATTLTMEKNSLIDASATLEGDGGEIVLWSDINNPNGYTDIAGTLLAKGATGVGGAIETSGYSLKIQKETFVSTSTQNGKTGQWLLDPYDFTIAESGGDISTATLGNALKTTSVTIQTTDTDSGCTGTTCGDGYSSGNGDIFINDSIEVTDGSNDTTLTLDAHRNINIAENVDITRSGDYKLHVDFQADGEILLGGATAIDANGGDVTLGNQLNHTASATKSSLNIKAQTLYLSHSLTTQEEMIFDTAIALEANSDVTITSENGSVGFLGTIDGDADLTLDIQSAKSSGKVMGVINAAVGSATSLKSFTTQGDGTIYINANITTSGAQTYNNDLYIGSGPLTQFLNNNFQSNAVGDGVAITNSSAFRRTDIDPNNVYEDVIDGWTLYLNRVVSGEQTVTEIADWPMPTILRENLRFYVPEGSNQSKNINLARAQGDTIRFPSGTTQPDNRPLLSSPFGEVSIRVVEDGSNADSTQSLQLNSTNMWFTTGNGLGIVRGPFVVSNSTAALSAGDSVSFDWKAEGNFDDFAVYAYLLNPATGHTIELLNAIGGKTTEIQQATIDGYNNLTGDARGPGDWSMDGNNAGWITSAVTLTDADPTGDYHFVFISGTWDADGGRQLSASMNVDNIQTTNAATQALFNTDDPLPGLVTLTSGTQVDFEQANVVTLQKDLKVIVPNANIDANLAGPGTIELDSANAVISGDNSHAATIISSGDLTLQYDELPSTPPSFVGTGTLSIQPKGDDFTAPIDLTNWIFGSKLEKITIGQASTADGTNDQNIILGDMSATGPISIFGGDITLNGDLASDGTITLSGSGALTDGVDGSVAASELLLLGGAVTLDSSENEVGTLAAEGVSSLTFVNNGPLTIGEIDDIKGIDATGAVSVSTLTGDLEVEKDISTTDDTADAIVLNAGESESAGTATGGDIKLADGVSLATGDGGQTLLYTGSVSGSTGVADAAGAGSGNFRYNSDETDSNFVAPLDPTGINVVYREQPTVNLDLATQTITYGQDIPYTATGVVNGDKAFEISGQRWSTGGFLQVDATGYTVSSNLANLGYSVTGETSGALIVNPLQLIIDGASGMTKVYDGTTIANVNGGSVTALSGDDDDEVTLSGANASFASANAGVGIAINTHYTISGADAGNYALVQPVDITADITPAPLTVTANNDAKFVTQDDPDNFTGVSYEGFVNGETYGVLGGTLNISRSNSGINTAGVYTDVLVASGRTSTNYDITFINGDFTIVPSNQLLVRVADVSNIYGTATNYALSSVEYYDGSSVVALGGGTGATSIDGTNLVSIADGAEGSAAFTVTPQNPSTSTAGKLSVGSYQLGASGISTENASNFNDTITVVGSHQVNTKALTPSVAGGVSKVYDGTTDMTGVTLALPEVETNDLVTIEGTGAFSQSNVGTGLAYTIGSLVLSGDDAANYHLAGGNSFGGNDGEITKRDIVLDYMGINKVYDGSTNASVNVSDNRVAGDTLTFTKDAVFDDKNVGTNKTINISNITLGGDDSGNYNLVSTIGTTTANITRLNSVTWVGGATGDWFDSANWEGGAVPDLSNVANVLIPEGMTVTFNNTVTGSATSASTEANAVNINSLGNGGSLQQTEGFLNVGNGGISLDTYTQSGGTLTNSGTTAVDSYEQTGGSFTGAGDFTTESFTQTGGETDLTANFTVNEDFSQTSNGTVSVGGNTDITDNSGGMSVGNLNTTGTTSLASTDGDIAQTGGTVLVSEGDATLTASGGAGPTPTNYNITLDSVSNNFGGKVTADGNNVKLVAIGNLDADVTAGGNSNLTSGGEMNAQLDVVGDSTLTASGDMSVSGNTSNLTTTTTNGGSTNFGNTAVGQDLSVISDGDIAQTGSLSVGGDAGLTSSTGNVMLNDESNVFNGQVSVEGESVNLASTGDLAVDVTSTADTAINTTGDLNAHVIAGENVYLESGGSMTAELDIDGDSTLISSDNMTVSGNTNNLNINSGGTTSFGETTLAGDLDITSDGSITQTGTLDVAGTADVSSSNGDIALDSASNDFGGKVTADGNNVELVATGNLDADVTAGGNSNLTSGGEMNAQLDVAGDSTLTASGDMSVSGNTSNLTTTTTNGGSTNFGNTAVGQDLSVISDGDIAQTGSLSVGGDAYLKSNSGDIILIHPQNNFAGEVTTDAKSVSINLEAQESPGSGNGGASGPIEEEAITDSLNNNKILEIQTEPMQNNLVVSLQDSFADNILVDISMDDFVDADMAMNSLEPLQNENTTEPQSPVVQNQETQTEIAVDAETGTGVDADTAIDTEASSETETSTQTSPEIETKTSLDADTGVETETETEVEMGSEAGTIPDAQSDADSLFVDEKPTVETSQEATTESSGQIENQTQSLNLRDAQITQEAAAQTDAGTKPLEHIVKTTDQNNAEITTQVTSEIPGAVTTLNQEGNLHTSFEKVDEATGAQIAVDITTDSDGKLLHEVRITKDGKVIKSDVKSEVSGAKTTIKQQDGGLVVETIVEVITKEQSKVRAIAITDENGYTKTRFERFVDGAWRVVLPTTQGNSSFEPGASVVIRRVDTASVGGFDLEIVVRATLTKPIVF